MDVVPSGYSSTPQIRKLGIRVGMRVSLVAAPRGWRLTDPPEFVRVGRGPADLMLWFVRAAAELADIRVHADRIYPDGALWVAWPRKAAGHDSDVSENAIRDAALPVGLVDVKVAAIDTDWSGLKIVWRTENRRR
jgi:hypothetical protein